MLKKETVSNHEPPKRIVRGQPSKIFLQIVPRGELDMEDFHWIEQGCYDAPLSFNAPDIVNMHGNGNMSVFRIIGPGRGVITTRSYARNDGNEIRVFTLAGRDLIANRYELMNEFKGMCRVAGYRWITCETQRRGMDKLFRDMGFYVNTVSYLMEISEGM